MRSFKIDTNTEAWDGFVDDVEAFNEKYPDKAGALRDRLIADGNPIIEWRRDIETSWPNVKIIACPARAAVRAFSSMKKAFAVSDCGDNERLYDRWIGAGT